MGRDGFASGSKPDYLGPTRAMGCGGHDEGEFERIADVAKSVDAADFNWSAHRETGGAEPLKVGES